jgi:hypothetical protein
MENHRQANPGVFIRSITRIVYSSESEQSDNVKIQEG